MGSTERSVDWLPHESPTREAANLLILAGGPSLREVGSWVDWKTTHNLGHWKIGLPRAWTGHDQCQSSKTGKADDHWRDERGCFSTWWRHCNTELELLWDGPPSNCIWNTPISVKRVVNRVVFRTIQRRREVTASPDWQEVRHFAFLFIDYSHLFFNI